MSDDTEIWTVEYHHEYGWGPLIAVMVDSEEKAKAEMQKRIDEGTWPELLRVAVYDRRSKLGNTTFVTNPKGD